MPDRGHLRAAHSRIRPAADHVHAAHHAAPRPGTGEAPDREACHAGLPEGAPELTVRRRHQAAARLVRSARRRNPGRVRTGRRPGPGENGRPYGRLTERPFYREEFTMQRPDGKEVRRRAGRDR
ncbi:DUF6238 family protein [Streptomyces sp. NPDC051569]|uniref:DUF6238 family protein n=1 Tax=Streptomyces sp. NPDC051569 TaxID=3365661 RepID=UPI00379BBCD4